MRVFADADIVQVTYRAGLLSHSGRLRTPRPEIGEPQDHERHMTRYGFLIDQDTCIGCHACTVACKAEHDVPLGVNRTWVKYIE